MDKPTDIDAYIAGFPEPIQDLLQEIRATIKRTAPEAEEVISYGMPAFRQNGILVYFAAFKNHIGFYPIPSGIEAFREELSAFKGTKGSVHFPLDKPLPVELIARIVNFRIDENRKKALLKKKI
ncbi:MAG: DUF1801 domain-containing protein [Paludibacter sp.]|nr:DUF1801 domain-containing protein [Paludibacter sp.]